MTALEELGRLVRGVDRAELWARDRAREYVDRDLLDPDAALRWVLGQAATGDPLVLDSRVRSGACPTASTPTRSTPPPAPCWSTRAWRTRHASPSG